MIRNKYIDELRMKMIESVFPVVFYFIPNKNVKTLPEITTKDTINGLVLRWGIELNKFLRKHDQGEQNNGGYKTLNN